MLGSGLFGDWMTKDDIKLRKHSYYKVDSLYYKYLIIRDLASGHRGRYTTVVQTVSGFIVIGRELTLGSSKREIRKDIETKARKRFYGEIDRIGRKYSSL